MRPNQSLFTLSTEVFEVRATKIVKPDRNLAACILSHALQQLLMIGQFEGPQDKGLFTFYREQAEFEQQIKRLKKEQKKGISSVLKAECSSSHEEPTKKHVSPTLKSPRIRQPKILKVKQIPYFAVGRPNSLSFALFNNEMINISTNRGSAAPMPAPGIAETSSEAIQRNFERMGLKRSLKKKHNMNGNPSIRSSLNKSYKAQEEMDNSIILLGNFQQVKSSLQRFPEIARHLRSSSELLSAHKKNGSLENSFRQRNYVQKARNIVKAESMGRVAEEANQNVAYINYLSSCEPKREREQGMGRLNERQKRLIAILNSRRC